MSTGITRCQHDRAGLRYPSDLQDAEWGLIAPLFPPARQRGRPRATDVREVLNAILYFATILRHRAAHACLAPTIPSIRAVAPTAELQESGLKVRKNKCCLLRNECEIIMFNRLQF